ncbi:MAG: DUF86 domain-containing protein [Methanomassiliicoccaceae archaeon]|nr:DUF86 domain-containing protein [Methanomassiliicoccaceae archaeon]
MRIRQKPFKTRLRERYPAIEWSRIAKFRDVIVHHYGKADLHIVWKTSADLIPELRAQCEIILKDLKY